MKMKDKDLIVAAVLAKDFHKLAMLFPGSLYEILTFGRTKDLMRQVIVYKGCWIGLLAWKPADHASHPRDKWIGWTPNQRVERLKLVVTNTHLVVNHQHPSGEDFSALVLKAAIRELPCLWEGLYGYRPLLAELTTFGAMQSAAAFRSEKWINIDSSAQRMTRTHWVRPLEQDCGKKLQAKILESPAEPGGGGVLGLIPIPDELLGSLKDALSTIADPRDRNHRYQIGAVLAIVFMAFICGYNHVSEVSRFASRLSKRQRGMLGLPLKKNAVRHDVPSYHVFYRLLLKIDTLMVVEKLILWLNENKDVLPDVLRADSELINDVLYTLALGHSPIQEEALTRQTENI
jgi:hypothetical protein